MDILGTSLRVCVDDLDSAVPVYERLTASPARFFAHGPVSAAAVGPFLLMSGPAEQLDVLRRISATIAVADLEIAVGDLEAVGADILVDPRRTTGGRALVARHPDGAVFEYVARPGDEG